MVKDWVHKKEKNLGIPNLAKLIAETKFSEVKPVLIRAFRNISDKKNSQQVLSEYINSQKFFGHAEISQRELIKLKVWFYSVVPKEYQSVELSPIGPLGMNSVITNLSQNNLMSTIRGSEVLGDPTTPLALESAYRRRKLLMKGKKLEEVLLSTTHRVLRLQPFDSSKGYMQHFNIFGLSVAGRYSNEESYNRIVDQISIWLNFVDLLKEKGADFGDITVQISDMITLEKILKEYNVPKEVIQKNSLNEKFDMFKEYNINIPVNVSSVGELVKSERVRRVLSNRLDLLGAVEEKVIRKMERKYKNIHFGFDFNRKAGIGYYNDLCFHIFSEKPNKKVQIADGGRVDWISKLLSDDKEASIVSGFGAELIYKLFLNKGDKVDSK